MLDHKHWTMGIQQELLRNLKSLRVVPYHSGERRTSASRVISDIFSPNDIFTP